MLAGWLACCLLAGCCWLLLAAGCWLAGLLLAAWLQNPAPLAEEAKKVHPRGHTAYNNRLLEAVKHDIYKMEAHKLTKNCKIIG